MTTEIVTLEEARRRLPRVRAHARQIMGIVEEAASIQRSLSALDAADASPDARAGYESRLKELERAMIDAVRSLNDLGGYLKDASTGLLDFYAWRNDELVFLCWQHGEDEIRYWHGLDEGYQSRKPLDDA